MKKNRSHLPIVLLLLAMLTAGHADAQHSKAPFKAYSRFVSKVFDISWKQPKGFTDLHTREYWQPNNDKSSVMNYNYLFRSEKEDCIILYPEVDFLHSISQRADLPGTKQLITGDLNLKGSPEETERKFRQQVTVLSGEDARQFFNADTVYICQPPLTTPYKEKYTHCTAIYAHKQNRPPLYFKCLFTDEGAQDKDAYIRRLRKAVRYGKGNWTYDDGLSGKERYRLHKAERWLRPLLISIHTDMLSISICFYTSRV